MVVDNLHVVSVARFEGETNSKLVVNANAPLSPAIAAQLFKAIPRWNAQKRNFGSRIEQ